MRKVLTLFGIVLVFTLIVGAVPLVWAAGSSYVLWQPMTPFIETPIFYLLTRVALLFGFIIGVWTACENAKHI